MHCLCTHVCGYEYMLHASPSSLFRCDRPTPLYTIDSWLCPDPCLYNHLLKPVQVLTFVVCFVNKEYHCHTEHQINTVCCTIQGHRTLQYLLGRQEFSVSARNRTYGICFTASVRRQDYMVSATAFQVPLCVTVRCSVSTRMITAASIRLLEAFFDEVLLGSHLQRDMGRDRSDQQPLPSCPSAQVPTSLRMPCLCLGCEPQQH